MGELNEFRKALELDALMVVTNQTGSNKQGSHLAAVTMQIEPTLACRGR
jgi:ABC-type cobalamin transport system ATPase subunit